MKKPRGPSIKTQKIFDKHDYSLKYDKKARHDALRSTINGDWHNISELSLGLTRLQSLYNEQDPEYLTIKEDKKYLVQLLRRYKPKWIG